MIIRRLKKRDLDALYEILSRSFAREMELRGFDSQRFWRSAKLYRLAGFLMPFLDFFHMDYPTILVASSGKNAVGEVHLVPVKAGIWTIDSLAVDPIYSGRGIGRQLIKGSVEYITKKRGRKALSSIRTDNTPALKIAERLGFSPFQKTDVFLLEMKRPPRSCIPNGISIRGFQSSNAEEVFKICEVADPTRTEAYSLSPKDLLTFPIEWLLNRMLKLQSEKLILEVGGRIIGYAHVTYTSQYEAGRIESFCLLPNPDFPRLAEALLTFILNLLAERNIRKVIISLDEKRKETIESLKRKEFRLIASFCQISKKLD